MEIGEEEPICYYKHTAEDAKDDSNTFANPEGLLDETVSTLLNKDRTDGRLLTSDGDVGT